MTVVISSYWLKIFEFYYKLIFPQCGTRKIPYLSDFMSPDYKMVTIFTLDKDSIPFNTALKN